ncbi:MAG: hypothetical protein IBJ18_10250 [Phycisphaerales bacterium]|nr:hypothetical protein [Phycisphaerales bacterium]
MTKPERAAHRFTWFLLTPVLLALATWALLFARPAKAIRGVNPSDRVADLVQSGGNP